MLSKLDHKLFEIITRFFQVTLLKMGIPNTYIKNCLCDKMNCSYENVSQYFSHHFPFDMTCEYVLKMYEDIVYAYSRDKKRDENKRKFAIEQWEIWGEKDKESIQDYVLITECPREYGRKCTWQIP